MANPFVEVGPTNAEAFKNLHKFKLKPVWSKEAPKAVVASNPLGLFSATESATVVEPYPKFLDASGLKYARAPIDSLKDRGIENRLLNNLVEYLPKGAFIAGGFMTSVVQEEKTATDIDIFFKDEEALRETLRIFLTAADEPAEDSGEEITNWAFRGYKLTPVQPKDWNYDKSRFIKLVHPRRLPIQLIKLAYYPDAESVIDTFDLTVAQFASDGQELVFNPVSLYDIARKRIVLHRMQFPASTLRRVIKYTSKGYYACPGALGKIAQEMSKSVAENPDDINSIVYVD